MSTPTFSVVIAAYNAADFIGAAITSALEQDPPPFEVIVADDGSTDDITGALQPFGDRVRLVHIEHGGAAAAKNAAAAEATGDFIALLDADDTFLPGRLKAMAELSRARPELDIITTDAHFVHRGHRVGRRYDAEHPFPATGQREAILRGNFVFALAAVRRTRFMELGGFDPAVAYCSDWDMWVRLVLSGSTIGAVLEPLADYRLHAGSMSAQRAATARGRVLTLSRAAARDDLSAHEREIVDEMLARQRAELAREEAREQLLSGTRSEARRASWRVAASSTQPPVTRVKAAVTALVPGLVGRRVQARERGTFTTVGNRRLPI